jgi:hypothetical protein
VLLAALATLCGAPSLSSAAGTVAWVTAFAGSVVGLASGVGRSEARR